jgi:uncharacterized protein
MKITKKLWLLPVMLLAVSILKGVDIPYLSGRVNDYAQILSPQTCQTLTEKLKAHENRTTNQIAILTIPTLGGESIEDYAVQVFEEWKLGQKDKDNGILIIVVPNDRRMRIEVGYGLEPLLTDGTAGQIIRSIMTPRFKNGDYDSGITQGVLAVMTILEGGQLPASSFETDQGKSFLEFEGPEMSIRERILIGAFIFTIIGLFTIIGIVTPGAGGWFLYVFLIPFWSMFPIIVLGTKGAFICLISHLILFPISKLFLRNTKWYKKAKRDLRRKGRASIGGFRVSSGSSSRSWSSGGSSFSGGGGSSGGGGASGSW